MNRSEGYPDIKTDRLCRSFGATAAVRELDLAVPRGSFSVLLGPNDADKSTTLRLLLNILAPSSGSARVLGVDSRHLQPAHLARIGYVAESQSLPLWMTLRQLLAYCRPLYPDWDPALERHLLDRFELPLDRRLRGYSPGMQRRAAMLLALAYRPQLLILDEPFSGLDPLAREELIAGMLELAGEQPWTMLLSSHDMLSVARLADHVSFINRGKLLLSEEMETLCSRFREVEVVSSEQLQLPGKLPASWLRPQVAGRTLRFVDCDYHETGTADQVRARLANLEEIDTTPMSLHDIFLVLAREKAPIPLPEVAS
jgi:ABC-2 type transport system ATP-binding protein